MTRDTDLIGKRKSPKVSSKKKGTGAMESWPWHT